MSKDTNTTIARAAIQEISKRFQEDVETVRRCNCHGMCARCIAVLERMHARAVRLDNWASKL